MGGSLVWFVGRSFALSMRSMVFGNRKVAKCFCLERAHFVQHLIVVTLHPCLADHLTPEEVLY